MLDFAIDTHESLEDSLESQTHMKAAEAAAASMKDVQADFEDASKLFSEYRSHHNAVLQELASRGDVAAEKVMRAKLSQLEKDMMDEFIKDVVRPLAQGVVEGLQIFVLEGSHTKFEVHALQLDAGLQRVRAHVAKAQAKQFDVVGGSAEGHRNPDAAGTGRRWLRRKSMSDISIYYCIHTYK